MTGGIWIAAFVALWVAVALLGVAVVVLLRQVGVLHARVAPMGVHFAGEGPELGGRAPATGVVEYRAAVTLVAFTSPSCEVCRLLKPSLRVVEHRNDDLALVEIELGDSTRDVFRRFNVSNTPYLVAVDDAGTVRGRGVANSLEQVEELIAEARRDRTTIDL